MTDDLTPPQTGRAAALQRDIQVTVEVSVSLTRRIMEETPIEFDHHAEVRIIDVPIEAHAPNRGTGLPSGTGQAVCAFDIGEIAVFEHGARTTCNVAEYVHQPTPASQSRPSACRLKTPSSGRTTGLAGGRKESDGVQIGARLGCHIEQGFFHPQSRWTLIPLHPIFKVDQTMDLHQSRFADSAFGVDRE